MTSPREIRIVYREQAPEDSTFAPTAFDGSVGRAVTVRIGDVVAGTGILVGAQVAEDGRSAMLTIDIAESPLAAGDLMSVITPKQR